MKFVCISRDSQVLISVWETRVKDFRRFADEARFQYYTGIATARAVAKGTVNVLTWKYDSVAWWGNPGFVQTATHPVVGVSWFDARAFCLWLTDLERKSGRIGKADKYRLPNDAEWSAAAGLSVYPWGSDQSPYVKTRVGNYFDVSCAKVWPGTTWEHVTAEDGFARTAPVGSFPPNSLGIYDLGGNALEWVEDEYQARMNDASILQATPAMRDEASPDGVRYRVLRGASWAEAQPLALRSSCRFALPPTFRADAVGFRVVLDRNVPD